MKSRKYDSYAEAFAALTNIGDLSYAGREWGGYIHGLKLPDGREYTLNIHEDGLVTILEPGEPIVQPERAAPQVMGVDLYKDGMCECMAAGRFKWKVINGVRKYMCVKCGKPKY